MHNSKNEIEHFFEKYLLKETNNGKVLNFFPCPLELDENQLFCFFPNLESFEEPDGFSQIGNMVMIFEHFEFDASKNTKKGSNLRMKLSENRKLAKEHFDKIEAKPLGLSNNGNCFYKVNHSYIKSNASKEDYIDNLIKQFTSHCHKRKNYETRIKTELQNYNLVFKECFFIEDKTIFSYYAHSRTPFNICLTNEFISIWKEHPEVDYIILGTGNTCYLLSNLLLQKENFESIFDIDIILRNQAYSMKSMVCFENSNKNSL